jgi:anti-sigma regulatory factor (Ser/Thr protein kinase)
VRSLDRSAGRPSRVLDINAERRFGVIVALGEAIANAIEHAYRGGNPGLI